MTDVSFIPRPQHMDTRDVGSWVCVCLTAGVLMVSQWASFLTGRHKNPPTNLVMGLDEGWTEGEETGACVRACVRACWITGFHVPVRCVGQMM